MVLHQAVLVCEQRVRAISASDTCPRHNMLQKTKRRMVSNILNNKVICSQTRISTPTYSVQRCCPQEDALLSTLCNTAFPHSPRQAWRNRYPFHIADYAADVKVAVVAVAVMAMED